MIFWFLIGGVKIQRTESAAMYLQILINKDFILSFIFQTNIIMIILLSYYFTTGQTNKNQKL